MADLDRILHVAVDRAERTWRVLEREDGSISVYYSEPGVAAHYVVYDSLDGDVVARLQAQNERLRADNALMRAALTQISAWPVAARVNEGYQPYEIIELLQEMADTAIDAKI